MDSEGYRTKQWNNKVQGIIQRGQFPEFIISLIDKKHEEAFYFFDVFLCTVLFCFSPSTFTKIGNSNKVGRTKPKLSV